MYSETVIGTVLRTSIASLASRKDIAVENNSKMYSPEMLVKLLQKAHIAQKSTIIRTELAGIGCEVRYDHRNHTVMVEAPLPVMDDGMEPQDPIWKIYTRQQSFSMTFYKIINDIATQIDSDWRMYDEMINQEVREMIIASKNEEA